MMAMALNHKYKKAFAKSNRHNAMPRLCLIFMLLLTALVWAQQASAQSSFRPSFRIELNSDEPVISIGPNLTVIPQVNKGIDYDFVIKAFGNETFQDRQGTLVTLGDTHTPLWLVFSVSNNTPQKDWVLDFGDTTEGRFATLRTLQIRDHTNGINYINTMDKKGLTPIQQYFLAKAAIPLSISPGSTVIFVIYLETEGIAFNTVAPKLIDQDHYLSYFSGSDYLPVILYAFLFMMAGFFIAVSMTSKNWGTLLFSAFYITLYLQYWLLEHTFISTYLSAESLAFMLLAFGIACGLLLTKFFFDIEQAEYPQVFIALHGAAALLVVLGIVKASPLGGDIDYSTVFMACFAGCIIILAITLQQMRAGKYGAPYYASAWGIFTVGALISGLTFCNMIPPNAITVNIFWLMIFAQAFFFVLAIQQKFNLHEELARYKQIREYRMAYNAERLKQSKKSADQARLLRVIEREREVMAELRERERQRNEDMRIAKDSADRANAAKSAFLAVVSHEIRTPMTGIMGMVRLLLDTKLSTTQGEYIKAMQKSGDTMMALLNDILDFEKIESGNMKLESISFDILKLVNGVVTLMSAYADEKGIYVRADIARDTQRYVVGDPTRLRQVILNLINNAIKFTEKGGVTIHLRSTLLHENIAGNAPQKYEVYLGIEDTGIGISLEAQEKLFRPFSQAEASTTRQFGGTGLGLAICKNLIENMGSSIRISSEQNVGSTFFFNLVMQEGNAELSDDDDDERYQSTAENDMDIPPQRILVIEDNQINRRVLYGLIEKMGHIPTVVADGEEGLRKLASGEFDMVFTDINLEGMSGIETTRNIRTMPNRKIAEIAVVALTGNTQKSDIESYYAAQINGYLSKPIDPKKLAETIRKAFLGQLENPLKIKNADENSSQASTVPDYNTPSLPADDIQAPAQDIINTKDADDIFPQESSLSFAEDDEQDHMPLHKNLEKPVQAAASYSISEDDYSVDRAPLTHVPLSFEGENEGNPDNEEDKGNNDNIDYTEILPVSMNIREDEETPEQAIERDIYDSFAGNNPHNQEVSPLQQFIRDEDEPDARIAPQSHDSSTAYSQPHTPDHMDDQMTLLNMDMMNELMSSLGKSQLEPLFTDYFTYADQIIESLRQEKEGQNISSIRDRAHELKGMAANFGFHGLSQIASKIEDLAQEGNIEGTFPYIDQLPDVSVASRSGAEAWLAQSS